MRRFRVYLDKKVAGLDAYEEIVEMPDDATNEACDEACGAAFDSLIENNTYGGWDEIEGDDGPHDARGEGGER